MHTFKRGQPIEVVDRGLAMIRAIMARAGNEIINHHGWVHSIESDGTIMVLFPIGDDDPNEHSQLVPYPAIDVLPRPDGEWLVIQEA
jgi:hypothetical protein